MPFPANMPLKPRTISFKRNRPLMQWKERMQSLFRTRRGDLTVLTKKIENHLGLEKPDNYDNLIVIL
jgi:hypothetical protein